MKKKGGDVPAPTASPSKLLRTALSGPFVWLFTEPVVAFICFYLALLYAVLYLTFVVIPLAFINKRHFSPESNGIIFISLCVGFLFGAAVIATLQASFIRRAVAAGETLTPEMRLRQARWASILPPIGLFIFAWTAPFPNVHWIAPCIGMTLFTMGMLVNFTAFIPYLVDFGGPNAPLLLAASTTTRSLLAAAFPLFATQMFNAMTFQGGCSMLAGVALLMVPLPLLLTRYGPQWRARNSKETT